MSIEQLRTYIKAHPDLITVTGAGRTAIVTSESDDHFTIVDLLLVAQLEVGKAPTSIN